MPQPNWGRMRRSPLAVDRMFNTERSIARSPEMRPMPPRPSTPSGAAHPVPRKSRGASESIAMLSLPSASNDDRAAGYDDGANRQIHRIVAGERLVAHARRRFV